MESLTIAGGAGDMNFGGSSPATATSPALSPDPSLNALTGDFATVVQANIAALTSRMAAMESAIGPALDLVNGLQGSLTTHATTINAIIAAVNTVTNGIAEVRGIAAEFADKVNSYGVGSNNSTAHHDGRLGWLEDIIEKATGKTSPYRIAPAPAAPPAPQPAPPPPPAAPVIPANTIVAMPGADPALRPITVPGSVSG